MTCQTQIAALDMDQRQSVLDHLIDASTLNLTRCLLEFNRDYPTLEATFHSRKLVEMHEAAILHYKALTMDPGALYELEHGDNHYSMPSWPSRYHDVMLLRSFLTAIGVSGLGGTTEARVMIPGADVTAPRQTQATKDSDLSMCIINVDLLLSDICLRQSIVRRIHDMIGHFDLWLIGLTPKEVRTRTIDQSRIIPKVDQIMRYLLHCTLVKVDANAYRIQPMVVVGTTTVDAIAQIAPVHKLSISPDGDDSDM